MAWQVYDAFPSPDYYPRHHKGYAGLGPLPRKRWVKRRDDPPYKLAYKWRQPRGLVDASGKLLPNKWHAERIAIAYAEWLAARDGIPPAESKCDPRVIWAGDRIFAVAWGMKQTNWVGYGRHQRTFQEFTETLRIEIPNWDFVHPPIEQCEVSDA